MKIERWEYIDNRKMLGWLFFAATIEVSYIPYIKSNTQGRKPKRINCVLCLLRNE